MEVSLHRRRGGEEGIYRYMIPDMMNVNQTIYIGVYSATTGEWYMYTLVLFNYSNSVVLMLVKREFQVWLNIPAT